MCSNAFSHVFNPEGKGTFCPMFKILCIVRIRTPLWSGLVVIKKQSFMCLCFSLDGFNKNGKDK